MTSHISTSLFSRIATRGVLRVPTQRLHRVTVRIFNPHYVILKLKGHLYARGNTRKKTDYRIHNKGRINTPREGVLSILILPYPTRSALSLPLLAFPHPSNRADNARVLFTLSRRNFGLLSFPIRIPQQWPKVFIVISRVMRPPSLARGFPLWLYVGKLSTPFLESRKRLFRATLFPHGFPCETGGADTLAFWLLASSLHNSPCVSFSLPVRSRVSHTQWNG